MKIKLGKIILLRISFGKFTTGLTTHRIRIGYHIKLFKINVGKIFFIWKKK